MLRPLSLIISLILSVALYYRSTNYDFVYDDILHIEYNSYVVNTDVTPEAFWEIFSVPTPPGNLYRPLSTLTYKLNYLTSDLDPIGYHITNIALYCISLLLFWLLLGKIPIPPVLSSAILIIFAVHPLHVEAVANIIGRAEILAGIFGVLSALLFIRASDVVSPSRRVLLYLLSGVSMLLGSLAKESAFVFLALAPISLFYVRGKSSRFIYGSIVLLGLAVFSLLLRKDALGSQFVMGSDGVTIWPENPVFHLPFLARLIPALKILGDYLYFTILPIGLSADYSMMPEDLLKEVYSLRGYLSILLVLATLVLTILQIKTVAGFFGIWFFVAFALTSNILTPIGTIMGDRLAYVPSFGSIGLYTITAWGLIKDRTTPKFMMTILLAFIGFLSLITFGRTPIWKNNQILFHQTMIDSPRSPKAYYNYGVHLLGKEREFDEAAAYFRKVLEMHPTHLLSMKNLADIALEKKEYARVEYWYRKILADYPEETEVRERLEKLLEFKQANLPPKSVE